MLWTCLQSFRFIPFMASEEMLSEYCFRKFRLSVAMATNQIQRSGQNDMFGRGLLKEHFCIYLSKYLQWDCNKCPFSFSPLQVNGNCKLPQKPEFLSDWNKKNKKKKRHYSFSRPIDATCEIWYESASWLQRRCRLKMLTDDRWLTTDNGSLPMLLAHIRAFGSGELIKSLSEWHLFSQVEECYNINMDTRILLGQLDELIRFWWSSEV